MRFSWMYYYSQLRRIAPHRAPEFKIEIERAYSEAVDGLERYLRNNHSLFDNDGKMADSVLNRASLLKEFADRYDGIAPVKREQILGLVDDVYRKSYSDMVSAVAKAEAGANIRDVAGGLTGMDAHKVQQAVQNPIDKLTLDAALEKHRADITQKAQLEIALGMANGDRYETVAKRMEGLFDGDFTKALRVARTETHRNSEAASWDAAMERDRRYQEMGAPYRMKKTWRTARDERVRPAAGKKRGYADHRKMDGETLFVDELFELDGSKGRTVTAQYPGDSGDAGNDINCRCRCSYKMVEVERPAKADAPEGYRDGGESGILNQEGPVEPKVVTPAAVERVPEPDSRLLLREERAQVQEAAKQLLRDVAQHPVGTEGYVSLSFKGMRPLNGDVSKTADLRVFIPDERVPYVSIHNHPSGLTFSPGDVLNFLRKDNLWVLLAVGNDGALYLMEKLSVYDKIGFGKLYNRLRTQHNLDNHPERVLDFMEDLMKGAAAYGIHYAAR